MLEFLLMLLGLMPINNDINTTEKTFQIQTVQYIDNTGTNSQDMENDTGGETGPILPPKN